jgi:hypothetical protein
MKYWKVKEIAYELTSCLLSILMAWTAKMGWLYSMKANPRQAPFWENFLLFLSLIENIFIELTHFKQINYFPKSLFYFT